MRSPVTFLLLACLSLTTAATARWGVPIPERSGRQLLDISVNATGPQTNFTLQVFALGNAESTSPCIFQGYPGSRADLVVPGPLVVNVPLSTKAVVNFAPLSNGAIVALYNQTSNSSLITQYNGTYGLITVEFNANDSSAVGKSAYITAGRVNNYNNSDPAHSWNSPPSCQVNVTFLVVPYVAPPTPAPAPAPVPAPVPAPEATASSDASGGWFSSWTMPKAPCFCTPVVSGKTTCFNFNRAGSDINCSPGNGYQCTSTTAPAGLYTQEAGPVFNCQTTPLATAG